MEWYTEDDLKSRCPSQIRLICKEQKVDDRCDQNARGCGRYWQILKKLRSQEESERFYEKYPLGSCPMREQCKEFTEGSVGEERLEHQCLDPLGRYMSCPLFWELRKVKSP